MNQNSHNPDPLDRILGALNAAEPPTGMDRRILQAVQLHATPSSIARSPWPRLAFALPLLAIAWLVVHSTRHARQDSASSTPYSLRPTPCLSSAPCPQPGASPTPHSLAQSTSGTHGRTFRTRLSRRIDAAAAAAEINQPPPPMPLTEQERLLLELAQRLNQHQPTQRDPARQNLSEASNQPPNHLPAQFQDELQFSGFLETSASAQLATSLPLIAWDTSAPIWPPLPSTLPETP